MKDRKITLIFMTLALLLGINISKLVAQCPSYTLCPGETYTLTAGANLTGYKWFKDGVQISGATSNTFTVGTVGVYTWEALDISGCPKTSCCAVPFTVSTNCPVNCPTTDYKLCPGERYSLTAKTGLTGYKWFRNGTEIAGETSSTFSATSIGSYTWTALDGTNCNKGGCCPIILVANTSCQANCPTNNCFSITIKTK